MNALFLIAALLFQQAAPARPAGTILIHASYADGTAYTDSLLAQQVSEARQPIEGSIAYGGRSTTAGDVRIGNLTPGRYVIRTSDSSLYYPGVVTLAAATVVTVTAGSTSESLNFVMPAAWTGFRVSGRVIRPASQPNPPTSVRGSSDSQSISGTVLADGSFELLHVRPGTYAFTVSPASGMKPVSVVVDRDVSGLELAMPKLFDIVGTLSVEGRPNLSGLFVDARIGILAISLDGPIQARLLLQADDTYKGAAIEGEYSLRVDPVPPGYYVKTLATGETDLLTQRLRIAASDKPLSLAMTLGASTGVKVSGKVSGSPDEISAAHVVLTGTVVRDSFDAAVNPDGSFTLAKVTPGSYAVRVASAASIASPPVTILIPNHDVADVAIAIPLPVNVSGRVTVDGNGPAPKFTLLLVRGSIPDGTSALSDESFAALQGSARAGVVQVIQVSVDALPDGSFKIQLPEGDYRVALQPSRIPLPYVLRSLTYAGANLMTDVLSFSEKESSEIQVGFGTTSPSPWSKVGGRVIGFDASPGLLHVALEGSAISTIETAVNADGTFEFSRIPQNGTYIVRLRPENKAASSPRVTVTTKDIGNVEIVVPREKEVAGRVTVENYGPVPSFVLSLAGTSSTMTVLVKPDPAGFFRIKLPEDERQVSIKSLPLGYELKSLVYGTTNLRACIQGTLPRCSYPPLKIADTYADELDVRFALDPSIPFAKVSGRVTGLSSDVGSVRLVLSEASSFSTFEVSIGADGYFDFSKVPQGTYVPTLAGLPGGARSGSLSPPLINVEGIEISRIELAFSGASPKRKTAQAAETPTGAQVSEFGPRSRTSAYEAAAVATLRTINTAEVTHLSISRGNYGSLTQLIEEAFLPSNFTGTVSGYRFGVVSVGSDFVTAAIPDSPDGARYAFYITPDGVVRYSTIESLAPVGMGGLPVQ